MVDLHTALWRILSPHAYETDRQGQSRCHCGERWTGNFDDHLADVLIKAGVQLDPALRPERTPWPAAAAVEGRT